MKLFKRKKRIRLHFDPTIEELEELIDKLCEEWNKYHENT